MEWSALLEYGVDFLPPFAWYIPGSGMKCAFFGLFFLGVSVLYLPLWWGVKTWLPTRKRSLLRFFSIVVWLGIFGGIYNLGGYSHAVPFAPIYPVIGLLALGTGIGVLLAGAWLYLQNETEAPPFSGFLMANLWHTLLRSAHFLVPLIIFNVPFYDHFRRVVYLGMPVLLLAVYLAIFRLLLPNLLGIFRLPLDAGELSVDDRAKFLAASAPLRQQADYPIVIVKPGLINAVALWLPKQIVVGADLVRCLEAEELRAVLTHELGHLRDAALLPRLRRSACGIDAAVLVFFVCILSRVPALFAVGIGTMLAALLWARLKVKPVRLQAEIFADRFVKDTDERLWPALLSGLEKLRRLNALDENFCKKHDISHLDIDERMAGVERGERIRRPGNLWRTVKFTLVWMLIGGLWVPISRHWFPSDADKWRDLHQAFHARQREGDAQAALAAIQQALALSRDKFGPHSSKTYLALNDLSEYYLYAEKLAEAEGYALQALEAGENIYGAAEEKLVRPLKNLGEIRFYREEYPAARECFVRVRKIQEDRADDPWSRANTLEWLSSTLEHLDRPAETVSAHEELIALYASLGKEGREWYLLALEDFAEVLARQGEHAKSRQYAAKALHFAQAEFGPQSEEYAGALSLQAAGERKRVDSRTSTPGK